MGYPHEAMVDMTGGVTEVFTLPSVFKNLPDLLMNLLAKGALINCANTKVRCEEWKMVSPEEQKRLGRVRREDGEFCTDLTERMDVSASIRMSVLDFQLNFDMMEVCHLTQGLSEPGSSVQPWNCVMYHGSWIPNITAGGSPNSSKRIL
ncbi:hypothetical protein XENOCAPTIV_027145 [Xenoophorus captivus]|uniref:Uncharacterized protein n=1 Tax=Xenoophorus captivus TaxID=1517983 RepID=A0ABV0QN63_9TELE